MSMINLYAALIPVFPLLGFLILGTGFRHLPHKIVSITGPATVGISFILSLLLFINTDPGTSVTVHLFNWINSGSLNIPFDFLVDPLSVLMLLIVTGVGFVIHVYSVGYMHDDPGYARFFAYMNLFIFAMVLLVLGANYPVMFIGWEGVGLCSYLLIGFWYGNHEYNNAAKKAFIMNRIGDLGFLLAMFLIYMHFDSLNYADVFGKANTFTTGSPVLLAITLLLFTGAVGKSAQIPLYTWLPDAMAGPTPVSALIHAATMVTAGVYLVARSNILFAMSPLTMEIIAVTGLATALFAAFIAIFQNDIKKVLAYSTISQLGYMFLALGTGAFTASMFHLTTHAFFKALLFLAAGSVIHAMSGEQDIRNMGGLKKRIPVTFWMFLAGTTAIAGIPPLSGFFSKDQILSSAFESSFMLWFLAAAGALITAYYMFRLLFLTFMGRYRGNDQIHPHESPKVMLIPLGILAFLSVTGGIINIPGLFGGNEWLNTWLSGVFKGGYDMMDHSSIDHSTEIMITAMALAGILIMIWLAWRRFTSEDYEEPRQSFIMKILQNKFYIDELYNLLIVRPVMWFSEFFHNIFEMKMISRLFDGMGSLAIRTGAVVRYVQTGNVGFYLFVMIFSIIGILVYNILLK